MRREISPELQLQCSEGNKCKYKNFLLLTHVSIHLGFSVNNHSCSDFFPFSFLGYMTSLKSSYNYEAWALSADGMLWISSAIPEIILDLAFRI
ncbi:hypothetical protein CEXT_505921 [Caerostris extrusa]|uniref:Uncharacterized protein n=1 Tax=Caerostris extrusa TaxID=172846 RepID=A0AAV4YF96_CAEEX|nr:hypothetical protein CEXT_505921 [Caerostris extrusa]